MIAKCVQLLRQDAGLRAFWQKRFPFLLVDEFQDINREQFEGVRILAGEEANLFVVGDDDQSIYAFRGSNPGIMIGFSKSYPSTHSITLSVNYRSLPPIITCGQKVIAENKTRLPKTAVAARGTPDGKGSDAQAVPSKDFPAKDFPTRNFLSKNFSSKDFSSEDFSSKDFSSKDSDAHLLSADACTRLLAFRDEKEEQDWVLGQLRNAPQEEAASSAVILRSNAQLLTWACVLEKAGIPYRFFNGINKAAGHQNKAAGYQAKRLLPKAALTLELAAGYCRLSEELLAGNLKREDFFLIMNQPERCLLRCKFREDTYTEAALLAVYPAFSLEREALQKLCRDLRTLQRLSPLRSLSYLRGILCAQSKDEDAVLIWDSLPILLQEKEPSLSHCSTAFLGTLLSQVDPWDVVRKIDQAEGQRRESTPAAASGREGVLLLTMHASKGLEFETVYLPDLNEGLFPGRRAQSEEAIEEERRLFYVAITRARDHLNLMYLCGTRDNPRRPSRFLTPLGVKPWE